MTINAEALADAIEQAEALRPILGAKAVDAMINKIREAQRVAAFAEIGAALHEALNEDPGALTPPPGSGSVTVFGNRSFAGLNSIVLPDGRKVRWNVSVVLDSSK